MFYAIITSCQNIFNASQIFDAFFQPFATSNLLTLYGLHQRYLNNLVARFREGLISDFYRYNNDELYSVVINPNS